MKTKKIIFTILLLALMLLFEMPAAATEEAPLACQNAAHHYERDGVTLYYPQSFGWQDENMDGWVPWQNHRNEQNEPIVMLEENGCFAPVSG